MLKTGVIMKLYNIMFKHTTLVTLGCLVLAAKAYDNSRDAFLKRILQNASSGTEAPPPLEYGETLKCD